ncbi:hypothetical protein HDU84_003853 [Entophlyctis sp. JEL0112]|nr:hypothetical protein HDU84_003853 [Entophlyctis sp. JEL0112]
MTSNDSPAPSARHSPIPSAPSAPSAPSPLPLVPVIPPFPSLTSPPPPASLSPPRATLPLQLPPSAARVLVTPATPAVTNGTASLPAAPAAAPTPNANPLTPNAFESPAISYQAKYIRSLEERLACVEKLRVEEARAAALKADALALKAQATKLRKLCLRMGISRSALPPPVPLRSDVSAFGDENEDDDEDDEDEFHSIHNDSDDGKYGNTFHSKNLNSTGIHGASANAVATSARSTPDSSATPWHLILRKLYPGQISHLRPHQRQLIDNAVHSEFLIPRLGKDAADKLLIPTSGSAAYYAVPAGLIDDFSEWFAAKMDDFVVSEEFSMKNSRRKSHLHPASTSSAADGATADVAVANPSGASGASVGGSVVLEGVKKKAPLVFQMPPRAVLPDGTPNTEGFRAWTDIIRARYPTFNRSGSHMCRVASQFCDKYKIKKVSMTAIRIPAVRSNKPAFALPQRYYEEFLEHMESVFLQPDGTFGREDAHLRRADSAGSGVDGNVTARARRRKKSGSAGEDDEDDDDEDDDEEDEEDEEEAEEGSENGDIGDGVNVNGREDEDYGGDGDDDDDGDADYNGSSNAVAATAPPPAGGGSAAAATTAPTVAAASGGAVDREQSEEGGDAVRASLRARGQQQQRVSTRPRRESVDYASSRLQREDSTDDGGGAGSNSGIEWKQCLLDSQRAYLQDHARTTSVLLKIRAQVLDYLRERGSASSSSSGGAVPDHLVDEFRAWFSERMQQGFGDATAVAAKPEVDLTAEPAAKRARVDAANNSNDTAAVAAGLVSAKESSSKFVSKSGLKLTKYNSILVKMMPDFKTLSREARVAIKRGVKLFLQHEMGDQFEECIFTVEAAEHHTYGVPQHLLADFKKWAFAELSRVFPDKQILDIV